MKNRTPVARRLLGSTPLIALCLILAACGSPTGPTPPALPGTPQGLDITTDGNGNSTLSWTAVSEADSYKVYHSSDGIAAYSEVSSTTGISYLLPFYGWYKVSAVNEAGEGAKSAGILRVEPSGTKAATPKFRNNSDDTELDQGSYDENISIKISLETGGDTLYYTTDGTVPEVGNAAFLYSGPIDITAGQTVTITAIASGASGYSNSEAAVGIFHVRSWEVVGSAGFSGGEVWYVSLAVDGDGHPWVAYMDASTVLQYKATVMRFDGNSWTAPGGKGISSGVATDTAIELDSAGSAYVSYKDNSTTPTSGMATVRRFNGASWTTLGTTGFSESTFIFPSLAVYDSGDVHTPFVAYKDSGNANKATVRSFNGTSWPVLGTAGISTANILGTSLAISENGIPYLAYVDGAAGNKVTVQMYDGSWSSVGTEGFSPAAVDRVSLAVSGSGVSRNLYVAFKDASASDKATVLSYDGSAWVVLGSAGVSTGTANCVTVEVAPDGTPYIAYIDGVVGTGKAVVRKFDGSGWILVGVSGFSPGGADYLDIALDSEGYPVVAFKDGNAAGKATVMAFR